MEEEKEKTVAEEDQERKKRIEKKNEMKQLTVLTTRQVFPG